MPLGFTNTKTNNNHKLLSHINLFIFGGKNYPSIFLKNRTPTSISFVKGGDPAMINQNHFLILLYVGKRENTSWVIQGKRV